MIVAFVGAGVTAAVCGCCTGFGLTTISGNVRCGVSAGFDATLCFSSLGFTGGGFGAVMQPAKTVSRRTLTNCRTLSGLSFTGWIGRDVLDFSVGYQLYVALDAAATLYLNFGVTDATLDVAL